MLQNNLVKFIIKRAIIFYLLISAAILIINNNKWLVIIGLAIGTAISVSKFVICSVAFERTNDLNGNLRRRSVIMSNFLFVTLELLLFPVLLVAYSYNISLFWGIFAGLIMVAFILVLNVLTETLRITKNNFFI